MPLAERLRPQALADIVGQPHLTGAEGSLTRFVASGHLPSIILWGPPGSGKTSIARLLADAAGYRFQAISAVFSGVADLKRLFAEARDQGLLGERLLLFVDEIHRFNLAQLDAFLPVMEDGTITLVGATTQNPSFELNAAMLSRAQTLILRPLDEAALGVLLDRAEQTLGRALPIDAGARAMLIERAGGDGRNLIGMAETIFIALGDGDEPLNAAATAALLGQRMPAYDKDRDAHFNLISALHKTMRGSDVDAALYYLARMLVAGEDPLYVLRRITRFAVEDVGMADPQALVQHANLFDQDAAPYWPRWSQHALTGSDGHAFTAPVGSHAPNAWGVQDMLGNVWEWVSDWHGDDYYAHSPRKDPQGPAQGTVRVRRGGSWHTWPFYARCSFRNWNDPSTRYTLVGIRLLRE